jgi:hypothetical protein
MQQADGRLSMGESLSAVPHSIMVDLGASGSQPHDTSHKLKMGGQSNEYVQEALHDRT